MENSQKGFIPVMLTPFLSNGNIDYEALTRLTELYLQAGSSGLFANCLSSEMFELNDAEKLAAIRHVIKVVNGAVPVVATGTFGGAISRQADFVKQVSDLGVEAVIAITSLLADEEAPDEIFDARVFELLDQTGDISLGFYECPVPYKRILKPKQLEQFVDTGRVIYHKDTCLDLDQIKQKLALTEGHAFGLYDAYMVHAVESLMAGASGLSCIQGNYFPELIVWLCDHYNDVALQEEVNVVQQFLRDHMDVMHHAYPLVSKYFLHKRGLNLDTFTRRNVGSLTPQVLKGVDQLYTDYAALRSDLNIEVYI